MIKSALALYVIGWCLGMPLIFLGCDVQEFRVYLEITMVPWDWWPPLDGSRGEYFRYAILPGIIITVERLR